MIEHPTQPIDDAVRDLLQDTMGEVERDPSYRPVLASSLLLIGYSQAETQEALNRLYKAN